MLAALRQFGGSIPVNPSVVAARAAHTMSKRKSKTLPTDEVAPESEFGRMLDRGVMKECKLCIHCRKPMVQRAKWKDNWAEVKFCSDRCRRASKSERQQGNQNPD